MHPKLELWHPSLKSFYKTLPPLKCADGENWVYVENGTFRIRKSAAGSNNIKCDYTPIFRPDRNDFKVKRGRVMRNMADGQPINADFFEVKCVAASGKTYANLHSGIAYKDKLHRRHVEHPIPDGALRLNILLFGFDSVSRMSWLRTLPKSHEYFVNVLGAVMLDSYNVIGDGTPQALLPILTGHTQSELPEARRGHAGAKVVDGHPWIWRDLASVGYVTQWGEDISHVGTFQYRMLGFRDPPVDHFWRPFDLALRTQLANHKQYCLRSMPRHVNMLNWVREFFDMYRDKPKFSFLFHGELSHQGCNELQWVDGDLLAFLKQIKSHGHLDNTLLILMSDHGARFKRVRRTAQGKYEGRMPYFGLRLPEWFEKKYPEAMRNLRTNGQRLATPFDIHSTFEHILNFTTISDTANAKTRGISLFHKHPPKRTCADAGISPHWCACLDWQKTDRDNETVKEATDDLVASINSFTQPQRELCENLVLAELSEAFLYQPPISVLRFKSSDDHDDRYADLSDKMTTSIDFYQVTVVTSPGGAIYEATIKHDVTAAAGHKFTANEKDISRTNEYGDQPHCIATNLPRLRQFCYCRNQLS